MAHQVRDDEKLVELPGITICAFEPEEFWFVTTFTP
jgi:hypothetical protein